MAEGSAQPSAGRKFDKRVAKRTRRRLMVRYGTSATDKTAFTKNVSDTFERAYLLFYLGMAHFVRDETDEAVAAFKASHSADGLFRPDRRQFPEAALAAYDAAGPEKK